MTRQGLLWVVPSALLLTALGVVFRRAASLTAPPSPKAPQLVLQTPPATSVNSVAVSPDGSIVATGAGEGGVRLYDARTGALRRVFGDDVGGRSVVFSPDGRHLAAAGFHMDKLVGVYDVRTGQRVRALAGHTEWEADATAISCFPETLIQDHKVQASQYSV